MTDQDGLHSNEKKEDTGETSDKKCENGNDFNSFCVETEEEVNAAERERWRRDAKNFETLIDKLFDEDKDEKENDNQDSAEE